MHDPAEMRVGDYRLVERLGAGGMGEVWRGIHVTLGRTVAVKLLSVESGDSSFGERFLNEARIQASLHHPHIATLYELVQLGDRPCIVMEYVDGETVADRLRRAGPMRLGQALEVFRQVVEAVGYIHDHGIVHRDLKANNVKIAGDGAVKLLDFGIARGSASPRLTLKGQFIGTLHSCAPEQLQGAVADHRSDVWALGVLLYELVTGRVPFDAESVGEFVREVEKGAYLEPSELVAELPPELDRLVSGCLQLEPDARFQSAQELLRAIAAISGARPSPEVGGLAPAAVRTSARPLKERWPIAAAVALLAVVVVVAIGVRTSSNGKSHAEGRADARSPAARPSGPVEAVVTIGLVGATARVKVNGEEVGHTPYRFSAPVGSQIEVVLEAPGYRPFTKRLEVLPHSNDYVWSVREFRNE